MIINIDDEYLVDVDQFNYTLRKKAIVQSGKTEGEEKLVTCGYFPTLESALERYLLLMCIDNIEEVNVNDLVKTIDDLFTSTIIKISKLVNK